MAEGPAGVTRIEAPPRDPRPIEAEIVRRRDELTTLVAELNRRRHELTDVRLQLRRHAAGVLITVLATSVAVAGSVAYARRRAHRRDALLAPGGRLREAIERMIDRPERVAVPPGTIERMLRSAASAVAVFLVKSALENLGRSVQRGLRGGQAERWRRCEASASVSR